MKHSLISSFIFSTVIMAVGIWWFFIQHTNPVGEHTVYNLFMIWGLGMTGAFIAQLFRSWIMPSAIYTSGFSRLVQGRVFWAFGFLTTGWIVGIFAGFYFQIYNVVY